MSKTVRRDDARPAAADSPVTVGPMPRAGFPSQARSVVSNCRFIGKTAADAPRFQG